MDLLDAVLAENEQLRVRVSQLESGLSEYRRQMDEVLSSVSWRVTSPLRMVAGRVRRAKALPRRWRRRLATNGQPQPVTGLFLPSPVPPGVADVVSRLGVPPATLRSPRPPVTPNRRSRVLVLAHVFYPEVWPDISERLARMPEDFDLIVTLVEDRADWLAAEIVGQFPQALVELVPNQGRDIAPMVSLANRGFFDGYDAILKVHTKRSPHRIDGDGWRIRLLDGVLSSPVAVTHILELLRRDSTVGLVVPDGHVSGAEHWGRNLPIAQAVAARLPLAFDPDALAFPAGSMFWCRPWVLQRLADFALSPDDFGGEAGQTDATTAHAIERMVGVIAQASGLSIVTTDAVSSTLQRHRARPRPRVLAFYLPQYHQIPENDQWWGEGFTDWRNVEAARPLFAHHLQPRIPGELGAYDLADPQVMRSQAALATEYGVDGFVIHHYWFNGRRLLERPVDNLLADPSIELPFALCWANENWTRRWDGLDSDVLMEQTFPDGWTDRFFADLFPALTDPRYIRVGGAPLLVIYRTGLIPEAAAAISRWKELAHEQGLGGLHVLAVIPSRDFEGLPSDVEAVVDGLVRFPPGSGIGLQSLADLAPGYDQSNAGDVLSYQAAAGEADFSTRSASGLRLHPGVMPGWDNTARRGTAAYAFHGSNPAAFRGWLSKAAQAAALSGDEPLLFVNAWNEWAESAYLEPDGRFGRGNLEAVRDAVPITSLPASATTSTGDSTSSAAMGSGHE